MAATDATPLPINAQAYRHYYYVYDSNGDPVAAPASHVVQASVDGAAFSGTGITGPTAVSDGLFYVEIDATRMTSSCTILKVTATGIKTLFITLYPVQNNDIPVNIQQINNNGAAANTLEADLVAGLALGSDITALNNISTAQVQTEVTNALNTYDPPTKTEMDAAFTALNDIAASDVWNHAILTGFPASRILRAIAALSAKLSGANTDTNVLREIDDSGVMLTVTVDPDGNRTAVVVAT